MDIVNIFMISTSESKIDNEKGYRKSALDAQVIIDKSFENAIKLTIIW